MWWQYTLIMENGSSYLAGSSFSSKTFALDAAMNAAFFRVAPVIKILIYSAK